MSQMAWIVGLIVAAVIPSAATASIIVNSPPNGPATLHDASFSIDFNGDGITDVTVSNHGLTSNGSVVGSLGLASLAMNVGAFRGIWSGAAVWPLDVGQQVGPATESTFLYSTLGLVANAEILPAGDFVNPGDYTPGWADGAHHFVGIDVPAGTDHHYAWIEMSTQDSGVPTAGQPWYDVTIYDWAYETLPNQPVSIPEPAPLVVPGVLLINGALLRRRRIGTG